MIIYMYPLSLANQIELVHLIVNNLRKCKSQIYNNIKFIYSIVHILICSITTFN